MNIQAFFAFTMNSYCRYKLKIKTHKDLLLSFIIEQLKLRIRKSLSPHYSAFSRAVKELILNSLSYLCHYHVHL